MPTAYLERPLRDLIEALADFKRDPFYQGDADGLAQGLLSAEGLAQYEARVRADARRTPHPSRLSPRSPDRCPRAMAGN